MSGDPIKVVRTPIFDEGDSAGGPWYRSAADAIEADRRRTDIEEFGYPIDEEPTFCGFEFESPFHTLRLFLSDESAIVIRPEGRRVATLREEGGRTHPADDDGVDVEVRLDWGGAVGVTSWSPTAILKSLLGERFEGYANRRTHCTLYFEPILLLILPTLREPGTDRDWMLHFDFWKK